MSETPSVRGVNLSAGVMHLTGVLERAVHDRLGTSVAVSPLLELLQTRGATAVQSHRSTQVATYLAGTCDVVPVETGEHDVTAQLVAFVRTPPAHEHDLADAVEVVGLLLEMIPLQRWGLPHAHPAKGVEAADLHGLLGDQVGDSSGWRQGPSVRTRARQLHGESDGDHGRGVWAVTWEQTFRIGAARTDEGPSERPQAADVRFGPPARPRTIETADHLELPAERRTDDAA